MKLKDLVEAARRQGWRVVTGGNNHIKLFAPDHKTIVTVASTESDHRAYQNTLSRMRRAGFRD